MQTRELEERIRLIKIVAAKEGEPSEAEVKAAVRAAVDLVCELVLDIRHIAMGGS